MGNEGEVLRGDQGMNIERENNRTVTDYHII